MTNSEATNLILGNTQEWGENITVLKHFSTYSVAPVICLFSGSKWLFVKYLASALQVCVGGIYEHYYFGNICVNLDTISLSLGKGRI